MGCVAVACEKEDKTPSNDKTDNPNYKPDEEIRDDQHGNDDKGSGDNQENLPDNGNNDNGEGGGFTQVDEEDVMAGADYLLYINGTASSYVLHDNGVRNDYITFYDSAYDRTLFIDFYADDSNEALAEGIYELGEAVAGNCSQEYTYFMRSSNVDFERFSEGFAQVVREADGSYVILARYTLLSGEKVAMQFVGHIEE